MHISVTPQFRVTTLASLSLLFSLFISMNGGTMGQQAHNVTVVETDPSITYEGPNTGDAPLCRYDANGNLQSKQPGCYNVANNCTSTAAMSQNPTAAASFQFQGSAIYINSLLYTLSPIYTITLDGKSTDEDGVRPSGPFICSTLFSATNLDPNINHTIRLSIKGPSPNRNMTIDPSGIFSVFSLIDFTFTVPDLNSNSTGTTSTANGTTSSVLPSTTSTTTSSSASTTSNNSAAAKNLPQSALLVFVVVGFRLGRLLAGY